MNEKETLKWLLKHLQIKNLWDESKTNEGTYIVLVAKSEYFQKIYRYIEKRDEKKEENENNI